MVVLSIGIAGVIDGFSRLPMAIECQTNEAETVSQCLLEGAEMYGLPTAVRSDKVRKNVITRRGADRGSIPATQSIVPEAAHLFAFD